MVSGHHGTPRGRIQPPRDSPKYFVRDHQATAGDGIVCAVSYPAIVGLSGTGPSQDGTERENACELRLPRYCTGFVYMASKHHGTRIEGFVFRSERGYKVISRHSVFGDHDRTVPHVCMFGLHGTKPPSFSTVVVPNANKYTCM